MTPTSQSSIKLKNNEGLYLNLNVKKSSLLSCSSMLQDRLQENGLMWVEAPTFSIQDFLSEIEQLEQEARVNAPAFSKKTLEVVDALGDFLHKTARQKVFMPHCVGGWSNTAKTGNANTGDDIALLQDSLRFFETHYEGLKEYAQQMQKKKRVWLEAVLKESVNTPFEGGISRSFIESKRDEKKALTALFDLMCYHGKGGYHHPLLNERIGFQPYDPNATQGVAGKTRSGIEGSCWHWLCSIEEGVAGIKKLLETKQESSEELLDKPIEVYALWMAQSGGFMDKNKRHNTIGAARLFPSLAAIERTAKSASFGVKKESAVIVKVAIEGLADNTKRYQEHSAAFARWAALVEQQLVRDFLNTASAESPESMVQATTPLLGSQRDQGQFHTAGNELTYVVAIPEKTTDGEETVVFEGYKNEIVTELGSALPRQDLGGMEERLLRVNRIVLRLVFSPVQVVKWIGQPCSNHRLDLLHQSCKHHHERIAKTLRASRSASLGPQTMEAAEAEIPELATPKKRRL